MSIGRAFTLIELLVYLALLACLSLLVFGFTARTYRFMLERTRAHHAWVRAAVTGDLLRRDVAVASPWPTDWDVVHATFKQLTMSDEGKPIEQWVGYVVDEKGLKRCEGTYVPATGTWAERTMALVNGQVSAISMQPIIMRGAVTAVRVTMKLMVVDKEQVYTVTVALRNRVIG